MVDKPSGELRNWKFTTCWSPRWELRGSCLFDRWGNQGTNWQSLQLSGRADPGSSFPSDIQCEFYFLHQNCNYAEFIGKAGCKQCSYASMKGVMFQQSWKRIWNIFQAREQGNNSMNSSDTVKQWLYLTSEPLFGQNISWNLAYIPITSFVLNTLWVQSQRHHHSVL